MQTSTRRGISYPVAARTDAPDIPAHITNLINALDIDTPFYTGTIAARPATGSVVAGSWYWATDQSTLYFNVAGAWQALSPLASPALSGTPTAPTPTTGDSSTKIATTAFVQATVPAGVTLPYPGAAAPTGWFLCDGTAISRTTYPLLFALFGTTFGAGDGSTTFNLPDLRGRIPVGKSASAPFTTIGSTGGETAHQLTTAEMASHTHAFTGTALGTHTHTFTGSALPTHTHVFTGTTLGTHSHTFTGSPLAAHGHSWTGTAMGNHGHTFSGGTVPSHEHWVDTWGTMHAHARDGGTIAVIDLGGTLGATGIDNEGQADTTDVKQYLSNSMTVTGTVNPASAGTPGGTIGTTSGGTPAGSLSSDSAGTPAGTNAAVTAGTPAGSNSSDSAGTPAGTNASAGSDTAHNNLQPYIVMNYIIKAG